MASRRIGLAARLAIMGLGSIVATPASSAAQEQPWWEQPVILPAPAAPATVRSNLIYKRDMVDTLTMDVYLPRVHSGPVPGVILIHGGPVRGLPVAPKDMGQYRSYGNLIAARELAAIAFSHRFTDAAAVPAMAADVLDAIAFVRAGADSLGIDRDALCVWAISAGGLALGSFLAEPPDYLRCVVVYYALLNAADLGPLGIGAVPDSIRRQFAIPATMAARVGRLPPLLIARAGRDAPAINRGLDSLAAVALRRGAQLDLLPAPDVPHGFDVFDRSQRSHEIVEATLVYVQKQLLPRRP